MAASIGRYLHQSLNEVERWPVAKFYAYHDALGDLLEAERPKKG